MTGRISVAAQEKSIKVRPFGLELRVIAAGIREMPENQTVFRFGVDRRLASADTRTLKRAFYVEENRPQDPRSRSLIRVRLLREPRALASELSQ